ncbi:MAG: LLM class flavin-dependent oxidoreductase [Actinobacteria bacterium]|nr:MAG: LLM class flavin-dependent oxidoreductase [Actinomycetota bacterium]
MTLTARHLLSQRPSTTAMGFVAPTTRAAVADLEDRGAASLWVGGHVASRNPSPEPMVWLARLVEQTSRTIIGTATLLLPLYPPGIVAKQLADLDRASNGRLAIGVGVGGEYTADFDACEVPIAERGSRTNEALTLLRQFWTAEPVTYVGRHHHYDDVRIHPAPTQVGGPPLIVTGRQPVAMRRAARLGDGWMPYLYSPERYARSVVTVRAEAERGERNLDDFTWFVYVFVSLDDDTKRARAAASEFLGGTYRNDFDAMVDRVACVGTVEQITDRLASFVDAGVEHFVLAPIGPSPQETARRLLDEIHPKLIRHTERPFRAEN